MTSLALDVLAAVLGATIATPSLHVVLDTVVPPTMRSAQDVRWAGENEIFLTAGRRGVHRVRLESPLRVLGTPIGAEQTQGGFFFSSRLAASDEFLLTASPFAALAWRSRTARDITNVNIHAFAAVVDVDLYGADVVILGADRDDKGEWAPEGAIAWRGSLSDGLADLHPVHYSASGPKAAPMANCGQLELGGVRFLADGSFVIVPGVEPGVFLYDASGRLKRTWTTEGLGFEDRCKMTEADASLYGQNVALRRAWINQHTVLDDVIALRSGPGLILRSFEKQKTVWTLLLLDLDGKSRRVAIPIRSSSPRAHLRADVRGDSILFLVAQYAMPEEPLPEQPRVVHVKMRGL